MVKTVAVCELYSCMSFICIMPDHFKYDSKFVHLGVDLHHVFVKPFFDGLLTSKASGCLLLEAFFSLIMGNKRSSFLKGRVK